MRNKFEEQLEQLNVELIKTGALCEDAISTAAKALLENDLKLAKQVKPIELEIDQKEREIEGLCMRLLLQQQPVAGDLRQISSALKMISDLERIGDQASDIAELLPYLTQGDIAGSKVHIKEMAVATIQMVTESVDSFVRRDLPLAQKVMADDAAVDQMFNRVKGGAHHPHRGEPGERRVLRGPADGGQVFRAHRRPRRECGRVGAVRHHRPEGISLKKGGPGPVLGAGEDL